MKTKKIGIMTTGGDCSGLNTVIQRVMDGCAQRKWKLMGIQDGTDGLYASPAQAIELNQSDFQFANSHISGSVHGSGL